MRIVTYDRVAMAVAGRHYRERQYHVSLGIAVIHGNCTCWRHMRAVTWSRKEAFTEEMK
jgi:hypothetical protein